MTRDGFMFLVMGYRGKKAAAIKEAIIKRFNDMEAFIRKYILARDDFPPFTQAVMDAHDEPKSYHYSNEVNLINRIVLGCTAKQFKELNGLGDVPSIRPYLSDTQLKAIKKLQTEDIRLLYRGVSFPDIRFGHRCREDPAHGRLYCVSVHTAKYPQFLCGRAGNDSL